MPTILKRQGIDVPLLLFALLLTVYGIAMVFSAGQTDAVSGAYATLWQRQLGFFLVALCLAYAIMQGSVRLIEWAAWPLYLFSCGLLVLVLFVGTGAGTAASMKSWLSIGGYRIGQPAELAKLATILMLARVLAARRESPRALLELWQPLLVVAVPWLLVLAQKDVGTAIVFIGICFVMLFWAGVSWPVLLMLASPGISLLLAFSTGAWGAWFLLLGALMLWYRPYLLEGATLMLANVSMGIIAPILWERLNPYQQNRLLVFLDPSYDPLKAGWNVFQSKVAIGSGGLVGNGFTLGSQKRLQFLPERHTDFIFSVVGEELGFIGVSIALTLFLALFLRTTRVASRANDAFPSLVAMGILAAWMVHVIVNIGMTLGLMPVTGIPLPFFSNGGSFLMVSWMSVAVLLRISAEGRGLPDGLGL